MSTRTLSTPRPVSAERRCSIVPTVASPEEMVVLRAVDDTFSASASIVASGPMSVLTKRIPVFTGAGFNVIVTGRPLCKPLPLKAYSLLSVFCFFI